MRQLLAVLLLAVPFPASADDCTALRDAVLALDQKIHAARVAIRASYVATIDARRRTGAADYEILLAEIKTGAAVDQLRELDRTVATLRGAIAAACPPVDVAAR